MSGWKVIDELKSDQSNFPENPDHNEQLNTAEISFYKEYYWDRFQDDLIPDQTIGEDLFDTSVNMGVRCGVTFPQEFLNLLNRYKQNDPNITLSTLNTYLASN